MLSLFGDENSSPLAACNMAELRDAFVVLSLTLWVAHVFAYTM